MLTGTQRAVASVAALGALVLLVGTAVFLAAREDPSPPPTTAPSTTSTTIGPDEVAEAIAGSLAGDLTVAITDEEAACVAEGMVALLPPAALAELAERDEPLTGVPSEMRDELVRLVVGCVPEASAAALLGTATTTTALTGLPDEGAEG